MVKNVFCNNRLYISCVLRLSGTYLSAYGSLCTTLSHISSVLKQSETNFRLYGHAHYLIIHLLCLKMVRNMPQGV